MHRLGGTDRALARWSLRQAGRVGVGANPLSSARAVRWVVMDPQRFGLRAVDDWGILVQQGCSRMGRADELGGRVRDAEGLGRSVHLHRAKHRGAPMAPAATFEITRKGNPS